MCLFNQQISECQDLLLAGGRAPCHTAGSLRERRDHSKGAGYTRADRKQQDPGAHRWAQVLGILRAMAQGLAPYRSHKMFVG